MKNFILKLFIVSFILQKPHGGSVVGAFPKPCSHQLFAYEQGFSSRAVLETRHAPHAGSSSFSPLPSAESSDLFWHDQMRFTFTVIVGIDSRFEFVGTQQPVWFRHRPLAMDPFRFYGVQPRAFAGQRAAHNTDQRETVVKTPGLSSPGMME